MIVTCSNSIKFHVFSIPEFGVLDDVTIATGLGSCSSKFISSEGQTTVNLQAVKSQVQTLKTHKKIFGFFFFGCSRGFKFGWGRCNCVPYYSTKFNVHTFFFFASDISYSTKFTSESFSATCLLNN